MVPMPGSSRFSLLAHPPARATPVAAQQAREATQQTEVLAHDYEEEARQRYHAAAPGPPYPTATYTPRR
jgi:hypothetical protein